MRLLSAEKFAVRSGRLVLGPGREGKEGGWDAAVVEVVMGGLMG